MAGEAHRMLVEAGLLPAEMPDNYTFNKVREILGGLSADELPEAIAIVKRQQIRGPLAVAVFIKHHLAGPHEAEVDRIEESEEGARYAVLVYAEGEVPVRVEHLPGDLSDGSKLRYDPATGYYR